MRPVFLHLDDALKQQPTLLESEGSLQVQAQDIGPAFRLWSRPSVLRALQSTIREQLPASEGVACVFAGSGDFHHVSPMLLQRALEVRPGPVTVLHFDNHPDWVRFEPGLHCGSWVTSTARHPDVERVLTIGVCSADIGRGGVRQADLGIIAERAVELYAYRARDGRGEVTIGGRTWPTIEALGEAAFAEFLATRVKTPSIYVTIDKDVLEPAYAATNWDQGAVTPAWIASVLAHISRNHRLIGVDIVGDWSEPKYGGNLATRVLKRGEALLDQPWLTPDRAAARSLNERVNIELLASVCEAAA